MIEGIMVFALGVLTAGLVSIAILPAFWRRAERLVRRQLERQLPLSPREIAAERDQLRAEFAVDRRRLEQRIETIEAARLTDRKEVGEKLVILDAAKTTILERDASIAALEATVAARARAIADLDAALADQTSAHDETRAALTAESEARTGLAAEHAAMTAIAGQRLAEIGVLTAQRTADADTLAREKAGHGDTRQSLSDQMRLHKDLQGAFITLRDQSEDRRRVIADHLAEIDRLKHRLAEENRAMQALRQTMQVRASEINALQRNLADARNETAMTESRLQAADALAARRQQSIEAKNDTLQAKSAQINTFSQQISSLRLELSGEAEARRNAERLLEAAERKAAKLETTAQTLKQQSQETARDLSRTIEALRTETGRAGPKPTSEPARNSRSSARKPLEFATSSAIPESDIVGLPPRK